MSTIETPNQSLADGVRCLQAVIGHGEPIGSADIARQLGLEPARANRLLRSLMLTGVLAQDDRRKYHAGPGIHVLAAQALRSSNLLRAALPIAESLRPLGHIVAVGVTWRDQVSYLLHCTPDGDVTEGIGRVGTFPASRSAIGHAVLAQADDELLNNLYAHAATIPGHPGGLDELRTQIRVTRQRGYAAVLQHTDARGERWSLGVALPQFPNAAIAISGHLPTHSHHALAGQLHDAALRITP